MARPLGFWVVGEVKGLQPDEIYIHFGRPRVLGGLQAPHLGHGMRLNDVVNFPSLCQSRLDS